MNDFDAFYARLTKGMQSLDGIDEIHYHHSRRRCVYQSDSVKLYQYHVTNALSMPPLLIVFATVNRPEILDIFPDQSFIKNLISRKIPVYLLDWGDHADAGLSFDDYVFKLDQCVNQLKLITQYKKINLLGICQGGVISLCYASLFDEINKLTLISTPVDFHTNDNTVANLLRNVDFNAVSDKHDIISGAWLVDFFISLRPFELVGKKYLNFLANVDDKQSTKRFLQVEKWLRDSPDQSTKAFAKFITECYQKNKLINGQLYIANQPINLSNISAPVLNVMGEKDEIVPMNASMPLGSYLNSTDYSTATFPSGHIGIYVSQRIGTALTDRIGDWLGNSSCHHIR